MPLECLHFPRSMHELPKRQEMLIGKGTGM